MAEGGGDSKITEPEAPGTRSHTPINDAEHTPLFSFLPSPLLPRLTQTRPTEQDTPHFYWDPNAEHQDRMLRRSPRRAHIVEPSPQKKAKTSSPAKASPVKSSPQKKSKTRSPAKVSPTKSSPAPKAKHSRSAVTPEPVLEECGSFQPLVDPSSNPHTLLLGTQPGPNSLKVDRYYSDDSNAFWALVGLELGFRRGWHTHARENGDVIPSFAKELPPREEMDVVESYEEGVRRLLTAGYAVWDFLERSERVMGRAVDAAIRNPTTADIGGFLEAHPTIRRVVFVIGKGSAIKFRPAFAEWIEEKRDVLWCSNEAARSVFGDVVEGAEGGEGSIELVVPASVSAAAAIAFRGKIDSWNKDVWGRK